MAALMLAVLSAGFGVVLPLLPFLIERLLGAGVALASTLDAKIASSYGIIDAARKQKCNAVFMVTPEHRGLSKLIVGRVTQKVLTHSRIPVVVFR